MLDGLLPGDPLFAHARREVFPFLELNQANPLGIAVRVLDGSRKFPDVIINGADLVIIPERRRSIQERLIR